MDAARRFFDSGDTARWGREEMPEQERVTREWHARTAPHARSLELGCGRGKLAAAVGGYVGVDLAFAALRESRGRAVQCDMEQLPFAGGSFDFVFSWAAIEHVPHPERVLAEVERVLGSGGVALLAPAWHCRPWAAEGLEFRPYAELTRGQQIRKALIPLRNSLLLRAVGELPRRVVRELRARRGAMAFDYGRLEPNLEEYVGTDCDAFTSMDPHAAIAYFATRGWTILSHPDLRARMLARHEPVVVRKP
ncbi:MAG TPA: class I SAM-dependent methyltransferase [Thermoanaerobaculia bacterium]|jgi:SAM-dependent methyltransferase